MRASKEQQIAAIIEAPGDVQKGYLAKWLVVCTFPHRDPGTSSYTRINGDYSLSIQTGLDAKGNEIGLPYGGLVRLLSFWIITECNCLKWAGDNSRRIYLGESMKRFVELVGYDPKTGHGKRGDAKRLRDMMERLFNCRISFIHSQKTDEATGSHRLNMEITSESEFWWDVKNPDQASLFNSWIEVGEKFYNAVTENPVPFDFRALCALKHSPLAIDLYAWLTWRVHAMKEGGSAEIPLHGAKGLAAQIGSNYGRDRDFKAALAEGLEAVKAVWPQMDCDLSASHLTVRKSPVPIGSVSPVKKRRSFAQVKANALMLETEFAFRRANPGIRFATVKKAFYAFLEQTQIEPHDIDALFTDYAAKWVKGEY